MREFVVRAPGDHPDKISLSEVDGARTTVYELQAGDGDPGNVIGERGQPAKAIRVLLTAAAARQGMRAVPEMLE